MTTDVLETIERYYDTAPRAFARTERLGPLTLFVAPEGWPYYARPRLGGTSPVTAEEVAAVLARQHELGVPRTLEWVREVTPSLGAACVAAGLEVHAHPLLVLERLAARKAVDDTTVRLMSPHDPDLVMVRAAIEVGFRSSGTKTGEASTVERDEVARREEPGTQRRYEDRIGAGLVRMAGAFCAVGAVGGGSHSPRDGVTEVTGVGVLPAYRRRGIAAQLTAALAADAQELGVSTVFCSADSPEVARVYERVGFRRIGTACVAGSTGGQ